MYRGAFTTSLTNFPHPNILFTNHFKLYYFVTTISETLHMGWLLSYKFHTHILSNVKTQNYYIWTQNITNITRTLHVGWLGLLYGDVMGRLNRWHGLIGHAEVYYTPIFVLSLFADHTQLYIYIFIFTFLAFYVSPVPWPIQSTPYSQPL